MAPLQEDKHNLAKKSGADPEPGRGLTVIIVVCALIVVAACVLLGTPLGIWMHLGFQKPH